MTRFGEQDAAASGSGKPLLSLSLDLDNLWSYMKTHGDAEWESLPSYLDRLVELVLERLDRHGLTITVFVVGQDAALEGNSEALRAIADLHFAPTRSCAENLLREGVEADRLFVTGNTVIDSLIMTISDEELLQRHRWQGKLTGDGRLVVVTLHRRESWSPGVRPKGMRRSRREPVGSSGSTGVVSRRN